MQFPKIVADSDPDRFWRLETIVQGSRDPEWRAFVQSLPSDFAGTFDVEFRGRRIGESIESFLKAIRVYIRDHLAQSPFVKIPRPNRYDPSESSVLWMDISELGGSFYIGPDLIHKALEELSDEFGIQPAVDGLLLPTRLDMDRIDDGSLLLLRYVADYISADRDREYTFTDAATKWLVLWNLQKVQVALGGELARSRAALINAILDEAPAISCWLTWASYVRLNWDVPVDWSAYPWPWELE